MKIWESSVFLRVGNLVNTNGHVPHPTPIPALKTLWCLVSAELNSDGKLVSLPYSIASTCLTASSTLFALTHANKILPHTPQHSPLVVILICWKMKQRLSKTLILLGSPFLSRSHWTQCDSDSFPHAWWRWKNGFVYWCISFS